MDAPRNRKFGKIEEDNVSQSSETLEWENSLPQINPSRLKSPLKRRYLRHFPSVEGEEILKKYSCALVSDFLRHGQLYVTNNYFAFYSNIFGYVTKLLIPVVSVEELTKEKTAKFIPNAIGIVIGEEKHVFSSFIQRDNTFQYMKKIWLETRNYDSDSCSGFSSEEDLPSDEELELDSSKLESIPETIPLNKKRKKYLLAGSVLIVILLLTAGVLFYKITTREFDYPSKETKTRSAREDIFSQHPELYKESYSAISGFMDKNINSLSKTRKNLENMFKLIEKQKQ
ncbi:unnamed protein product [Phyllotreta striolata]|uniref:GRAM domain-containing protein n=1 Tax=Phyllotreta striolata TaxID=444603 RepID=A0A9N9TMH3_PHYSR|nr:unnamed protein product [Phyllotreta striolata]